MNCGIEACTTKGGERKSGCQGYGLGIPAYTTSQSTTDGSSSQRHQSQRLSCSSTKFSECTHPAFQDFHGHHHRRSVSQSSHCAVPVWMESSRSTVHVTEVVFRLRSRRGKAVRLWLWQILRSRFAGVISTGVISHAEHTKGCIAGYH